MMEPRKYRLGILASHPIQYYAPWFRDLAQRLDLQVLYAYSQDAKGQSAAGFGVEFQWDVPLLDGYSHEWLNNISKNPGLLRFGGCDTPELAQRITSDRFDAFLVFGWNRKSSWQAMRACWRQNVPLLMRGDSQLPMVKSRIKSLLKAVPYRWFLPKVDTHLYVGQRNREYLQHYGVPDERLVFCPHFIDADSFAARARQAHADGTTAQIRNTLQIPDQAFVALFVGKLIPKKNPQHLIDAVQRIAGSPRPVHAIIVGSGPLEAECRSLAAASPERIHFAGFQNQSKLPAYYAASDALVLPSDGTETWGLVVNEAMSCDKPCVVSASCGCSPDMILEGRTGFVFPEGDIAALAAALAKLARFDEAAMAPMRLHLRQITQKYSIQTASSALLDTLQRLSKPLANRTLQPETV